MSQFHELTTKLKICVLAKHNELLQRNKTFNSIEVPIFSQSCGFQVVSAAP